ncbi:MAG: uracil-DNA glycosylase [Ignavibacteriales bacterium]|nr:uracil-DNA glycosylase [Ignavibacteriales bacterium]
MTGLRTLQNEVIGCTRCPRLVQWRTRVATEKTRRFQDWNYWGKPVPGFGDARARLLIVGLAPAAHGANRTGRMFTGDRSGDWLYRALHKAGFASKAHAESCNDGLVLRDCYITAAVRCAPPANRPTPREIQNCKTFLIRELTLLRRVRVILGLGRIGFVAAFKGCREAGLTASKIIPRFGHGVRVSLNAHLTLMGSFHPSQQNTFTGKLTEPMFDSIFHQARILLRKEL